jgi:hypothetical protein
VALLCVEGSRERSNVRVTLCAFIECLARNEFLTPILNKALYKVKGNKTGRSPYNELFMYAFLYTSHFNALKSVILKVHFALLRHGRMPIISFNNVSYIGIYI